MLALMVGRFFCFLVPHPRKEPSEREDPAPNRKILLAHNCCMLGLTIHYRIRVALAERLTKIKGDFLQALL